MVLVGNLGYFLVLGVLEGTLGVLWGTWGYLGVLGGTWRSLGLVGMIRFLVLYTFWFWFSIVGNTHVKFSVVRVLISVFL